jgi:hypothetical protein
MDYLVFQAPVGKPQQGLKCVVKNTFLEMVDADPSSNTLCARTRSLSESRVSLTRRGPSFDDDGEFAEENFDTIDKSLRKTVNHVDSCSTLPSIDGGDASLDSTPRDSFERNPTLPLNHPTAEQPKSPLSWTSSPLSSTASSWYDQLYEEQYEVPEEVLEALHELTNVAAEEQLKREDIMNYKVTEQLYPYIPVDDQGLVTSLGSILHALDACKPCAFLKKDRCHKKDLCLYCHFEHGGPNPKPACTRKSKSKRMRMRLARQRSNVKPAHYQ